MDAGPSHPAPAHTPAGPLARLERWHAALLRLVGPNGRPVCKMLLLAPLGLLSAALSLSPPRQVPPVTGA